MGDYFVQAFVIRMSSLKNLALFPHIIVDVIQQQHVSARRPLYEQYAK